MIALLLLACGPSPRSWPSIDAAALQVRLDEPTAVRPNLEAVVEEIADVLRAGGDLESIPAALDSVLAEPGTAGAVEAEDEVVSGTSAFFEVACPGTESTPDPDFVLGAMRLEGPFLLEDGSLPALGPLYLSFDACQLGPTVVDGGLRARWLPDQQRLLALGDIEVFAGDVVTSWDAAFDISPSGLSLSYALERGTVTLVFGDDFVRVAYADGGFRCTLGDSVACDAQTEP